MSVKVKGIGPTLVTVYTCEYCEFLGWDEDAKECKCTKSGGKLIYAICPTPSYVCPYLNNECSST